MNIPTVPATLQFLSGGGQMSDRIRAFDWASTSLGPPDQWSQSLKTSVNLMLNCQQPVWIGWGQDNIFMYNDPYIEVLGLAKHAWALGHPAPVVWAEIWDFCGPLSDKVYQQGESSFVNDVHFFMNRGDLLEEVFYSFSYSPIYDETGKVGGLFCPNIETTAKMLSERRLHTLSKLAATALVEKTTHAACETAFATLAQNREDIPFALLYLLDASDHILLEQTTGLLFAEDSATSPATDPSAWPLVEVLQNAKSQLISVSHLTGLPLGLADLPVDKALVLPVASSGQTRPIGVLIVGINPTRRLDAEYVTFYELLAGQVATAIQNARTAEEARQRADALAEIDRAKTVFFSNISHEFRTPLTLMLGSLEELLREGNSNLTARDQATIETTHRNAIRLLRLVNALLDFSRIEAGRTRAQFQRTDLAQYTADLASNFRPIMEKGGLGFQVDCPSLQEPTYVDKEMWEKIVLNLLSNAFKYTLTGSITMRLRAENEQAILTVQDTGVGIPAAELPKMFERFHRVQNVVGRTFEGTGIGLSLVRELVGMHGGEISVASQEGVGSTFTVRIPLGKAHLSAEQILESEQDIDSAFSHAFLEESITFLATSEEESSQETIDPNLTTILVVDDNADMRMHIKTLLGRHYRVVTAHNGAEALERMAQQPPALVLSDIMMPVMDGLELLKAIKGNPRTAQVPVVLLSARAGEEARIEGFDIGADDYLVKPFSAKELLARIKSQIRLVRTRAHVEQQLRNLFIQAPMAICILRGPEHVVEMANEPMLEIWGKTVEQVMYKPVLTGLPELEGQGFQELLDGVYQTGERFMTPETPLKLMRNGQLEKIHIKFVYEALREEDGQISGIMVLADEITVLVEARQLAQRMAGAHNYAYEQIRNLFLQAPTAIQILRGPDFILELANKRILELWGRTEAEVINRPLFDIIPEVRAQGFDKLLEHVYRTGERYVAEEVPLNFLRDGQLVHAYAKFVYEPLREPDGSISGIMVVGDEITPQVLARQKIEESERRFRLLAETLPQLIWMTDHQGVQEYASSRWEEFTGIQPTGADTWAKMVHPDDIAQIANVWEASRKTGDPYRVEARLKNQRGNYRWHFVHGEPIRNADGQIVKWIGAFTNIHDQKTIHEKLEKQVVERTAALHASNESLAANNQQLLRANQELESFNYVASHDLQEPLRKIQTFANLLQIKKHDETATTNYLDKITAASQRMSELVQALLHYSRLDNVNEFEKTDLNAILEDVKTDFELSIEETGAVIISDLLPIIAVIPMQMHQLFTNLIGNALKFREKSPVIMIAARSFSAPATLENPQWSGGKEYVELTFSDNGIGFDAQYAEHIFQLFKRLHSRDEYSGTGIGLSICKKIVEHHGGSIKATSVLGEGAVFVVTLPVER